jgi:CBS domain-containing protein
VATIHPPEASSRNGPRAGRRGAARGPASISRERVSHYTLNVSDITEAAVSRRVPSLADERLRVLSRRQPVTVLPGTPLADCIRAIQRTGTGDSVFVCDATGRLTGVLTERDIFGRIVAGRVDLNQPVEHLMTTDPRTLDLDDTIRDAIVLMQTGRYRNVPMVDDAGYLVGVVRQSDIINYLAESFPEELLNLPPRLHQRMKAPEGG